MRECYDCRENEKNLSMHYKCCNEFCINYLPIQHTYTYLEKPTQEIQIKTPPRIFSKINQYYEIDYLIKGGGRCPPSQPPKPTANGIAT